MARKSSRATRHSSIPANWPKSASTLTDSRDSIKHAMSAPEHPRISRKERENTSREMRESDDPRTAYDEQKFKELILYIAEKAKDDPNFGDIKLNKVLFWSDMLAYGYLGEAITGATYQKLEHGPAARRLLPARRELKRAGDADTVTRGRFYRHRLTVNRRLPDTRRFSTDQLDIVDEVFAMVSGGTAADASDFSHEESAGWRLVELQEDIPYQAIFVSPRKPPPRAFERGRELAAEHGW